MRQSVESFKGDGKRIVFFVARYSGSGVPLAQLRLARAFASFGYQVDFVFLWAPRGDRIVPPPNVHLTVLDYPRVTRALPAICKIIAKRSPDLVFSAEDHLNAIVTAAMLILRCRAKLSVSSRVTPFDTYRGGVFSKGWVLRMINPMLWWRADALTCVSEDMVEQYRKMFGRVRHQAAYNVIVDSSLERLKTEIVEEEWFRDQSVPVVVSAGRLAPEKGFDRLIEAFALTLKSTYARLVILGDGPERDKLERRIAELGIANEVRLLGFRNNPYKYFYNSRVFVLSSIVEGLPNVLVEALACGCSVVSTDCPTGPREVLQDGLYGRLVPTNDTGKLADAILGALEETRDSRSKLEFLYPFTVQAVVQRHLSLLGLGK